MQALEQLSAELRRFFQPVMMMKMIMMMTLDTDKVMLVVKNPPANAGDLRDAGSTPGPGRFSGEGNCDPLQYSCLEDPMDRGAWWATVHGIAKSWTRLSNEHVHFSFTSSHQPCSHMLCGYCSRSWSSAWRFWGPRLYTS